MRSRIKLKIHPIIFIFLFFNTGLKVSAEIPSSKAFIKTICFEQFSLEMKKANQKASPHIKEYACGCFLKEINKGFSINYAQSNCKEKAKNKFNL